MNQKKYDEDTIDLLEVFNALKKKAVVIILVSIIGAAVAGGYAFFVATPIYESTAKIYISTQSTSITSLADIQVGSSLAYDYQEMIVSRKFLNELKSNLGLTYSYKQMHNMVTVENPANTRILNISIKSPNPEEAKTMANELANISKVNISEIMKTDEPTFYEKAIASNAPVEPQKKKIILIGFLLGFLLSAGIVVVRNIMNDKFTNTEDIESILELPVLASVPIVDSGSAKSKELKKQGKRNKNSRA